MREYDDLKILNIEDDRILLSETDGYETVDINHLREKSLEEMYQDFTAFIEPDSSGFDPEPIIVAMPKFGYGVYTIESAIAKIVLLNINDAKIALRDYYYNLIGAETIQTVLGFIESDLNGSKASKKLYMHRNTLNYRLDHFISVSGIDVRTFQGAFAIHMLFKV